MFKTKKVIVARKKNYINAREFKIQEYEYKYKKDGYKEDGYYKSKPIYIEIESDIIRNGVVNYYTLYNNIFTSVTSDKNGNIKSMCNNQTQDNIMSLVEY